ncbi:MAG: TatD family hydrolase [Ruminococcus sp.]|uniref:TatD family hydrolase n=1 Tax=Ruminococcus sp. TaxID=41978 RepID=UPI0025E929E5|nr:TatD family hydrolase [Ruminococcus sp.]MCR5601099.1 TatD family hydrolase [Ruminococcus sp.]
MIKYYDIGLNLFCKQFREPEKIINDAAAEGVSCILTGSDMKSSESVNSFVKTHDCFGTCGIHPHSADSAKAEDFQRIRKIVSENEKIVAVGECGLDYDRMFSTRENQVRCFEHHIRIAEELGKPLFLHEREAADDFIARFKKHGDICSHSVVHCFTGDKETLKKYLDMGFYIGITGWICDERRSGALREAVKSIPLERVMIETDAPYLTPRNIKGLDRTNVPQNIKYVAAELAKNIRVDEKELIEAVRENTKRFFNI